MLPQSIVALAVDTLIGEPSIKVHPTVRMGNFIKKCTPTEQPRIKPRKTSRRTEEMARGIAIESSGILLSLMFGKALKHLTELFPYRSQPILEGYFLKHSLAVDALLSAALEIESALKSGDLVEARRLLAWHLVSRDTTKLTESEVIGATIESIAENLSDSFIAPLFMYRIGGLPAAFSYRFINTADAMLGYRTPQFEHLGKAAAITDDVANLIPSRITALCIALASGILGFNFRSVLTNCRKEASRTSSPNAGWPMGAIALALNCRLTKRNNYVLNDAGEEPTIESLVQARKIIILASGIAVTLIYAGSFSWRCIKEPIKRGMKRRTRWIKLNAKGDTSSVHYIFPSLKDDL